MNDVDWRIGQLVEGRYRIVRRLGSGGMGIVYEVQHERFGKRLALKCLNSALASHPEALARFHREAVAATKIGNEHIVEVTDMGALDDGSPFLVMEFLEGIELGALLEKEPQLPIPRLIHIIDQICDALAAVHAQRIVHRDIKPANVYLIHRHRDPDFVKLLDFGISRIDGSDDAARLKLTATGAMLGTPYYMAPEQVKGARDLDHRVDIYAVGVMLFEGLSGRLPFQGDSQYAIIDSILRDSIPSLRPFCPGIPAELEDVVYKAMSKNPTLRYRDMRELAQALQPYAGTSSVTVSSERPVSTAPAAPVNADPQPAVKPAVSVPADSLNPVPRRSRWSSMSPILLVSLALLTAVLAPIGFAFVNGHKDEAPNAEAPAHEVVPARAEPPPDSAFEVHTNGTADPSDDTVVQRASGLTWQRGFEKDRKQWQADEYCRSLTRLRGSGWRLPTKVELESLIRRDTQPAIDLSVFPKTPVDNWFWTSTPSQNNFEFVLFYNGNSNSASGEVSAYVRCVR